MGNKDTTLTPLWMIDKLGKFDLDPCAYQGHNTARELYVLPKDGLKENWYGRVWLNPPYSDPKPFLEKMVKHNNGIALVLASVETGWFQKYIWDSASAVFFQKGRPKFLRENGTEVQLMRPTVLVAYGEENAAILEKVDIDGKFVSLTNP
jgi:hypothetical protein